MIVIKKKKISPTERGSHDYGRHYGRALKIKKVITISCISLAMKIRIVHAGLLN